MSQTPPGAGKPERKSVLLRLDPAVHAAVVRWAQDDLRSTTAQIELLLRSALKAAGRLPVSDHDRQHDPKQQRGTAS